MTVLTTTNKTFKLGDGVTSAIPFAFRIFAATDLVVVQTNIATGISTEPLVLNVDYTVTGVGNYNGGEVTETTPAPLGIKTTVARVLPLTQQVDIRNQGAFSAEIHEDVFDRLNMVDQQQQEQIDRGISFPIEVFVDDFNTELPSELVGMPGSTLMVNAAGNGFEVGPNASEIISGGASAAASAAAALASLNSALEAYGLTVIARDAAAASAAAAATFDPALYLSLAGAQTITGNKLVPLAAVDTNTAQIASTAFVLAQAAAVAPSNPAAAAAVGSSTRYARANHVHAFPDQLSTASGAAPSFACRAWVNFNGQGTVAIRASGNVSSITDNGVGDYTINFTTAMPDANYALAGMSDVDGSGQAVIIRTAGVAPTTTAVRIATYFTSVGAQDHAYNSVLIIR